MSRPSWTRRAGVILPLSALRSRGDLGAGDIGALPALFDWMRSAGLTVLQLLPLNDLAPADNCPYSGLSAFAMDPLYASLPEVPEVAASAALRAELAEDAASVEARRLRGAARVRFAAARAFKLRWLMKAFGEFERREEEHKPDFQSFRAAQAHWLEDYALFRALKEDLGWTSWLDWPAGPRDREPGALARERERLESAVRFHEYVQWTLWRQWERVRAEAAEHGVLLFGDIPFGLNREAADVWARREEFDLGASMGAPPDQYSATGQAWGLPAYRWGVMEAGGHAWWRARVRHAARLYDLFRLDHAVGFYRTWIIRPGGHNGFDIEDEREQAARGERFFRMTIEESAPALPVAEDLGVIPGYVHETLGRLGVPGYKVTRWEQTHDGFRHPREFPELSVATTGNHDTSTLAAWWGELTPELRDAYWRSLTGEPAAPRFSREVLDRVLEALYGSPSVLALLPFQDLFGTRERVNVPASVNARNWTYRARWTLESLLLEPKLAERAAGLKELARRSGR